jgi:hypothetical protein
MSLVSTDIERLVGKKLTEGNTDENVSKTQSLTDFFFFPFFFAIFMFYKATNRPDDKNQLSQKDDNMPFK